jgi:hypothetical protein
MSVPPESQPREDVVARNVGVGCFTLLAGFFSGGMLGVFVAKIVQAVTGGPKCEGIPTCDWAQYMIVGAAVGAITLPVLALWRLNRRPPGATN